VHAGDDLNHTEWNLKKDFSFVGREENKRETTMRKSVQRRKEMGRENSREQRRGSQNTENITRCMRHKHIYIYINVEYIYTIYIKYIYIY